MRLRSAATLEFYLQGTAVFSVLPELPHRVRRKILSAHFFFQCLHSVEGARPVQERASQPVLEMSSRSEGTRACMTSHALLCGRVAFGSFPPTVEEVTRSANCLADAASDCALLRIAGEETSLLEARERGIACL